ncbi:aquaporin Z [Sulfitobacter undariae]|uniref:Aquaporin Z n=1 Tax=Sulfitobacter undariae TaxID=1563671 RepID=A0A7W6EAD0_9RHOB|nr:aquaporin [Sulfitobacter undariae]MBB3995562.1 aquaporin Z [Sulfitobacter undariae]
MRKYIAEAFGTFVLVFFGVGSAVLAGGGIGIADSISITGISLAFGISVIAMAYSIGQISGAHLNPAVSMGALVAGRMTFVDFMGYALFQTIGAIIAAGAIFILASNSAGGYDIASNGMGQNGYGADYGGEFFLISAFLFEVIATAVFIVVILGVTAGKGTPMVAGLVIGFTLTMIHLVGITVTGTSVNPARSIGPALFVGGTALSQLWVFIVAPLIGGAIGGILHRTGITGTDSDA